MSGTWDKLLPVILSCWAGMQFATAVAAATIQPDDRWWRFAIGGVFFLSWAVWAVLRRPA